MAADWDAGGVVREICIGWEEASEAEVVELRFLGGLHRLVLTGQAPELAPYYRNLGGTRPPTDAWKAALGVVAAYAARLHEDLAIVPQTNEVGRTALLVLALYRAAAALGRQRIRLLEVGASAGLNLRVDRYRITSGQWAWGPVNSPVHIDGDIGVPIEPVPVEIVTRRGCDLNPIDPSTEQGRLRLRSFVWPDNVQRYRRLEAALYVAARVPVIVDQSEATPWLLKRLADPVDDDVVTVVWHSVVWQYLAVAERQAAEKVIEAAAMRVPVVHAQMEPIDLTRIGRTLLTVTTYHGGVSRTVTIGESHPHGLPIRWFGSL
jgi:hypothetical protein